MLRAFMAHIDPIVRFQEAFARARASEPHDPTAMSLATADAAGAPSVRVVLLKEVDARGFAFYTNRESNKGDDLARNPRAALCFYWPSLGEQVRVEGEVEKTSDAESDAYFASRPRESQLGAWASRQSRPLERHDLLAERFAELDELYRDRPVPRPRWWGGYRVLPRRIEFWKNGAHRLHHREVYSRAGDGDWTVELLNP
jgi:pyridoxamine 5'-phosphate oxidase